MLQDWLDRFLKVLLLYCIFSFLHHLHHSVDVKGTTDKTDNTTDQHIYWCGMKNSVKEIPEC